MIGESRSHPIPDHGDNTVGLVLRSVDFSETSKVVTFFTRDFGKVAAIAKGGRRLKSPFEVALELLSVCDICRRRKPSAELDLLTEARLVERFDGLRRNLGGLYGAYYIAEVLEGLLQVEDPHPVLFEETRRTLRHLAAGEAVGDVLTRYLARLQSELGFGWNLEGCVECPRPLQPAEKMYLSVPAGGLLCTDCAGRLGHALPLAGGAVQTLRQLQGADRRLLDRLVIPEPMRQELCRLLMRNIEHLLGRRPRSAELVSLR